MYVIIFVNKFVELFPLSAGFAFSDLIASAEHSRQCESRKNCANYSLHTFILSVIIEERQKPKLLPQFLTLLKVSVAIYRYSAFVKQTVKISIEISVILRANIIISVESLNASVNGILYAAASDCHRRIEHKFMVALSFYMSVDKVSEIIVCRRHVYRVCTDIVVIVCQQIVIVNILRLCLHLSCFRGLYV